MTQPMRRIAVIGSGYMGTIASGQLGVKTGQGFYSYPNPAWQSPDFLSEASPW